jgi:hypothetical protein
MKRSSWIYHVPTSLQHKVFEKALEGASYPIDDDEGATVPEGADDTEPVTDYKMEMQSTNVMKSVTGGVLRGQNAVINEAALAEFLSKEKKEYMYKIQPRRVVAQVDVRGEAKPEKIAAALKEIRSAVEAEGKRILGRDCRLRSRNFDEPVVMNASSGGGKDGDRKSGSPDDVLLGLQLWNIKACFNQKAEPAMAIYEIQYSSRLTRVHVEVELL